MPQRHSQNNGSHTFGVFSHEERRKCEFMQKEKARIRGESFLPFGYCALTLQPAEDPVITPSGHIYSREPLLEYMATKSTESKRRRDEWEAETLLNEERSRSTHAKKKKSEKEEAFRIANEPIFETDKKKEAKSQALVVPSAFAKMVQHESNNSKSTSNDASFWLPHRTPQVETSIKTKERPPSTRPPSPITGASLRMKDLIPITLVKSQSHRITTKYDGSDIRYLCHVSNDQITTQKVLFIRTTGCLLIEDVAKRLGILDSRICPITGRSFKLKDVITLATARSSFAASGGTNLIVEKYRPTGGGA